MLDCWFPGQDYRIVVQAGLPGRRYAGRRKRYICRLFVHSYRRKCINLTHPQCERHFTEAYLVVWLEDIHTPRFQALVIDEGAIRALQVTKHILSIGIANFSVAA